MAKKLLESQGYRVVKAGGSLGEFDLIALGSKDVRCVQVKYGTSRLRKAERLAIKAITLPSNCRKEYWYMARGVSGFVVTLLE